MNVVYIAVTLGAAAVYGYAAYMNFTRDETVIRAADRVRVPHSWMYPLGTLLAAGSLGLIAGFAVPALGTAAAVGLVVYFVCAVGAHVRVHDSFGLAALFLLIAIAALTAGVAERGLS